MGSKPRGSSMCWRSLPLVLLAACASGAAAVNTDAPRPATIYTGSDVPTIYADAPRASTRTIAKPPADVWKAVKQAHVDFSIPLTVEDPARRQLGNPDFYRARQFVGRQMTEIVSCGAGITGPNAASFRIYMSVMTTVASDGKGGTTVSTTFTATARDLTSGTSGDRLPCGSTGAFEGIFLDRVRTNTGA